MSETEAERQLRIETARLNLAVTCIGECLADLGRLQQRGLREDNEALRGGIALGLQRAAAYVLGKSFEPEQAPQHHGNKGTMG